MTPPALTPRPGGGSAGAVRHPQLDGARIVIYRHRDHGAGGMLPTGYLVAVYALYTQWHPPALSTPWLWPARPPHDLGGAICAALMFAAGLAVITWRGARDHAGDPD